MELLGTNRPPARAGSGTEGERAAAAWLHEQLEALGYDVEIQPFRSPHHTLYLGPTAVIVIVLAALWLSSSVPWLAALLAAAAFVPLVGELLGAGVNFNLLLPKSPSQNVIARPSTPGATDHADGSQGETHPPASRPDVVIVAHYDTQWGSWLFAPWFRRLLQPFFFVAYARTCGCVSSNCTPLGFSGRLLGRRGGCDDGHRPRRRRGVFVWRMVDRAACARCE